MEIKLRQGFALDPGQIKAATGRAANGPLGPPAQTMLGYFLTPAVAATSAAKSVSTFSMPSPRA